MFFCLEIQIGFLEEVYTVTEGSGAQLRVGILSGSFDGDARAVLSLVTLDGTATSSGSGGRAVVAMA